jgi:PD-(D/E)XK nuclease superfamily
MSGEITHLSNSQLDLLLSCARRYYLRRILQVDLKEVPSWWLVGGSSVHLLTETYERRLIAA